MHILDIMLTFFCVVHSLSTCHIIYVEFNFALLSEIAMHFKKLVTVTALPLHVPVPGMRMD